MSIARFVLPFSVAFAFAPCAQASVSAVEELVRKGDALGALDAVQSANGELAPADAAYWKGRALVMLGRLEDAAESFAQVPYGSRLYPYAARGLLYCAWRSPQISIADIAPSLLESQDAEIASLALEALAEHQVKYAPIGESLPAYEQLKEKAAQTPSLKPLLALLNLHIYRRKGDYDGGVKYAKELEHENNLTPITSQRIRLALAELYYAKERASEDDEQNSDEGKGEETLLQFISANPESPLLQEAFRRLYRHSDSIGSEYARSKLRDWADDTAHPKRAALALFTLQQMSFPLGVDPAVLANRAASELPGEPLTPAILQEHIRKLFAQQKNDDATPYLSLLDTLQKESDARTYFLNAWQNQNNRQLAIELFSRSAACADSALLTPALVNTLICATLHGDTERAEALLAAPTRSETKRALLLAHAGLLLHTNPAKARREIEEAQRLLPTPEQETDLLLDLAQLDLAERPHGVYESLSAISAEERRRWTEAQQLRFAALAEQAADAEKGAHEVDAEQLLYQLYTEAEALPIKEKLALHLAERMTAHKRHRQALDLLLDLAKLQPSGENKAITLYKAGCESASLGSLAALETAVSLFAESAKQSSALTPYALIEQAATLVRINRTQDALALLHPLEQRTLAPEAQARLYTVLADAYGMDMTPPSLTKAMELCDRVVDIPHISPAWVSRALLQRAALCSRMNRHEDSYKDYRKVVRLERQTARPDDEKSCFLLYYAAAGAVYQLMQMEQYEEAAKLADAAAAWPGSDGLPSEALGPKSANFRRWAHSIRQTRFLPIPVLGENETSLF